jgi:hypothetical protein
MPKVNIELPKDLLTLPEADRKEILDTLAMALKLPKVQHTPVYNPEHSIWSRSEAELTGQAEDEFFELLAIPWRERFGQLFAVLDLPVDSLDIAKALTPEYVEWEMELLKSNGKTKISDIIEAGKKIRNKFLKFIINGKSWTKEQLNKLDTLLASDLPKYAKIAEEFITRAGFLGKIRDIQEREMLQSFGVLVDRFPQTIEAGRKEGLVLRAKDLEGQSKNIKVLPLTEVESHALQSAEAHCASKLIEIDDRIRHGIKQIVIRAKKERWNHQQLAQALWDQYGDMNRDWRRVAITELSYAENDGYLLNIEEAETVISPTVSGACQHCQRLLENQAFTVTHDPEKMSSNYGNTYIWPGKSNYGRKIREWWPCIPLHPNCRHRWHRISRFYKMINGQLVLKSTKELINEERVKRGLPPDHTLD